jgi:hypothetical protein
MLVLAVVAVRLEQVAADDELLHLARAFVDAQRPDLAVEPLDRLAALHAAAAPHLHRRVDHLLRAFGGGELGHRRLARDAGAGVAQPGGAVGEKRGAVDRERHLRELRLRELEVAEDAAEHLPRGRSLHRLVEGAPREAERGGGDRGAEDVERPHRDLEALALRRRCGASRGCGSR